MIYVPIIKLMVTISVVQVMIAVGGVRLMISVGRAIYTGLALLHLHLSSGLDRSEM